MCDVPSIAVFCCESIECFPGIASKFFLRLLLILIIIIVVVEGDRKLDRDHEHCKPKGEEDEEQQRSMAKKIRGRAEERCKGKKGSESSLRLCGRDI
jgi:hypothetical protein